MFQISDLPEERLKEYQNLLEYEKEEVQSRKVAVIAVYCNRFIWTKCCFPSLMPEYAGMDYNNYRLFLVNNNSTDSTAEFFNRQSEYKPFIEQIRHEENKGKPWAFNHALKQIPDNFDYVVSIYGDVEMPQNWLFEMIVAFEELKRSGVKVGQLACDYELMPGCVKTVNPNSRHQPDKCKILPSGIVLDTTPDVAGGCLLWETKTIKSAGGYQIIPSPITGKNHLYGMDDGLINLHLKQRSMLSCYLVNVKAKHWGDYDEALFGKYQDWKKTNLNPIMQAKVKPHEIGEDFEWKNLKRYEDIADVQKVLMKHISPNAYQVVDLLYRQGCKRIDE